MADVAAAAGVSAMTVSRALSGKRTVDPALVERVHQVSQKLGYVPDPAARALASHRSNHVAVLIPLLSNELFVTLLEAVQLGLRQENFQTFIGVTHYNPAEEEQLLKDLKRRIRDVRQAPDGTIYLLAGDGLFRLTPAKMP